MINRDKDGSRRNIRPIVTLLLLVLGTLLTAGVALASLPAGQPLNISSSQSSQGSNGARQGFQANVQAGTTQNDGRAGTLRAVDTQVGVVDMTALNIQPSTRLSPDGNVVGTGNAFMSISPEVISTTTTDAAGIVGSGFTGSENVDVYFNGSKVVTFAAATDGIVAFYLNTAAGQGFITVRLQGQTSGKIAAGVAYVFNNAARVPGLAIAPHSISPGSTDRLFAIATGYGPTTTVAVARNTTNLGSLTTNANGGFTVSIGAPVTGPNDAAVYNSYITGTVGSLAGQSIEERADAGPAAPSVPEGDRNVSRAFLNRAVEPSYTNTQPSNK